MSTEEIRCVECGRLVEVCACCQNPECRAVLCYRDLVLLVGQSLPQPHTHGG